MIARLLALVALVSFSVSSFAGKPAPEDQGAAVVKQLAACDETEAAKHLTLAIVAAIGAAFSSDVKQALQPYEAQMEKAQSCADYSAAYKILAEAVEKVSGKPVDEYFSSAEGKEALENVIKELRKLK
jgi:hypothetical protein